MKKLTLITVLAIFAMLTASIAQPMQGRGFGKGKKLMGKIPGYNFYDMNQKDLGLNADQLKKLKSIDDSFQKERIDARAKIQHAGLELKNEADKTNINKDVLLSKQDNVQKLRNDMQKRAMSYKIDLYNVLTDEQRSKIDDIKRNCPNIGNMGPGGKGQCDGMGKGLGKGNCNRR
ncbi:MAG: Spy/CpxP family protein refolding chaperone [bacterium]